MTQNRAATQPAISFCGHFFTFAPFHLKVASYAHEQRRAEGFTLDDAIARALGERVSGIQKIPACSVDREMLVQSIACAGIGRQTGLGVLIERRIAADEQQTTADIRA